MDLNQFSLYVRMLAFISLFALCIISLKHFFHLRWLFAAGLFLNVTAFLVLTVIGYFIDSEAARGLSDISFAVTLTVWVILWTIDLGNNGRDT